jgi:putative peptidoglycan lipid II flippase
MGVTIVTSSYVVANNIPNMVYELVAGGILSSVFIPIFIERLQRDGDDSAWKMASSVFNLAMIVLGVVALAGTVWAEPFVRTQTFRIPAEEAALATYFFRFFAVQIVFYGVSALFTGVLNSYRYFFAPAAAPIFNNLVVIVTLLGFYLPFRETNPELAVTGLAIGTTLGVLVMALVQIPSLWRIGIRYTPKIDLSDPSIRKMGKKMIPIFIYVATNMVALSFRNAYAFEVAPEGPAALQYAWMFYQLPYGIFAVALATAIFPELSSQADRKEWDAFRHTFSRGLRATGVLVIPLAALLIALSVPVITLYRAGDFAASDVPVVASVLTFWAAGLFSFAAYMYLLRSFYSIQDTTTPTLTNFAAVAGRVGLYAALTVGVGAFAGLGLRGIPLADAIVYSLHFLWLLWILRRRLGPLEGRATLWSLVRMLIASVLGAGAAWGVMELLGGTEGSTLAFLAKLVSAGLIGLVVSFGLAAIMRVPEIEYVWSTIRRVLARFGGGTSDA